MVRPDWAAVAFTDASKYGFGLVVRRSGIIGHGQHAQLRDGWLTQGHETPTLRFGCRVNVLVVARIDVHRFEVHDLEPDAIRHQKQFLPFRAEAFGGFIGSDREMPDGHPHLRWNHSGFGGLF